MNNRGETPAFQFPLKPLQDKYKSEDKMNNSNLMNINPWVQEQREMIINYIRELESNEFKLKYPNLYNLIGIKRKRSNYTRKDDLKFLLTYFVNMVNVNRQIDGKPYYFPTYNKLMKILKTKKRERVSQSIALFSLLNIIEKVPVEYVPEQLISVDSGSARKSVTIYCIDNLNMEYHEERAKFLKDNSFSITALSREWVYRTFNLDETNRIYPQFVTENEKGTSEESDIHTIEIVNSIFTIIDELGYATEKAVIEMLKDKYFKKKTQTQIKKSLQEILDMYNLKRVQLNKELKEKLNVSGNGYPKIIIREDE